jgi:hypothetical protein
VRVSTERNGSHVTTVSFFQPKALFKGELVIRAYDVCDTRSVDCFSIGRDVDLRCSVGNVIDADCEFHRKRDSVNMVEQWSAPKGEVYDIKEFFERQVRATDSTPSTEVDVFMKRRNPSGFVKNKTSDLSDGVKKRSFRILQGH